MDENKNFPLAEESNAEEAKPQAPQQESYKPRPVWQIVAAWIGVGIMALGFALYCCHIAGIL